MTVLLITYYDIWSWPITMLTNVAKECKNEKHKNNLTQSSQRTKEQDIMGPIFTLGGTAPWRRPLVEKIIIPERCTWLDPSKRLWNFNFLAVTVFEIRYEISHIYTRGRCAPETSLAKKLLRGSQIYTRGTAPWNAPSPKIVISKKCTWPYLNVCKISTF